MWYGYMHQQDTWAPHMDKLVQIHTSGHASRDALAKFVRRIAPKQIIPVHTECKDDFESVFGVPSLVLDDNEVQRL